MRKTIAVLALAALTVLASAPDAFAQRRGGGGARVSVSVGRGGYYGGYRGGYYGYRGYGYYPYYGRSYYYTPSYYSYAAPLYYANPVVVPTTEVRDSYYNTPAPAQQETGMVRVLVPTPTAQIWFDGTPTNQRGTERMFHSPPLDPSGSYTYAVRARWTENGRTIDREQRVTVQPGQTTTVDFRISTGENLPPPR